MKIGFADHYLTNYHCDYFVMPDVFLPFDMVVVIPCYNEPDIDKTLQSLFQCQLQDLSVGVVVVINSSVNSPAEVIIQNQKTAAQLDSLRKKTERGIHLSFIQVENLPMKQGGVGWARKIGMDWAVAQFNHFGYSEGIIVSLDADTVVDTNYLEAIKSYFIRNPEKVGATINFEHLIPLAYQHEDRVKEAIIMYELYMRFYRNALVLTGFPASIYTVGSCFAVKAEAYIAQGGMNRRKAGEDFYFLHKLAMYGEIGEINGTTVYPSARISDRVPFGTGPIIGKYCEGDRSLESTYPLDSFLTLKPFFSQLFKFYKLGEELVDEDLSDDELFIAFTKENKITGKIIELVANCSNVAIFEKRFFHLFNAFMVLKWLNYSVLNSSPRKNLLEETHLLLRKLGLNNDDIAQDPNLMLNLLRQIDRERTND